MRRVNCAVRAVVDRGGAHMASSYDRIAQTIYKSAEMLELLKEIKAALKGDFEVKIKYNASMQWNNGKDVLGAYPVFMVKFDFRPHPHDEPVSLSSTSIQHTSVRAHKFSSSRSLQRVFDANFGIKGKCPTYNCKRSKAWETFENNVHYFIDEQLAGEQTETTDRVRKVLTERFGQEEIDRGLAAAKDRHIVDSIKKEILKWNEQLPKELLRKALHESLDEVVIHTIMDE